MTGLQTRPARLAGAGGQGHLPRSLAQLGLQLPKAGTADPLGEGPRQGPA